MFHDAPIDCKDSGNHTPLFYASKAGVPMNVFELCENGANVNHKVSCSIDSTSIDVTALYFAKSLDVVNILLEFGAKPSNKSMIRFMNENSCQARAILDSCLSKEKDENNKDMLFMDFTIFKDSKNNDMTVFQEAKDHILNELLLHPLMKMFLHLKFFSMNSFAVYYAFILYALLVASYVGLGYTYVQADHCHNLTRTGYEKEFCFETSIAHFIVCPYDDNQSKVEDVFPEIYLSKLICHEQEYIIGDQDAIENLRGKSIMERAFLGVSAFLTLMVFLGEVDQMRWNKLSYFYSVENILQCLVVILAIPFYACWVLVYTANGKIIVSWMVLLSCVNFTAVLARVDRMRPYIHMFGRVIKTMLWCILAFVPSLLGFSSAFYLQLNHMATFDNPFGTIIKTLAMAIGELDYSDNFDRDNVSEANIPDPTIASSKIMLVIFILSSLMFLNLMVSVSVHDVQSLYKESELIDMQRKIADIKEAQSWDTWRIKRLSHSNAFKIDEENQQMIIRSIGEPKKWRRKFFQFLLVLHKLKNVYYFDGNNKMTKLKFSVPKRYFKEGLKLVEQNENKNMALLKNILKIRQSFQKELKSILYNPNDQSQSVNL